MDCLFCSIVDKKIDAYTIYEDDDALSFLDIYPQSPGHSVVIPKRHMETFLDMRDDEIEKYWKAVQNTLKQLDEKLGADGFTIGINHGKVSGQSISHLHCHIIPRYKEDKGGSIHSVVSYPSSESVEDVYKRIK